MRRSLSHLAASLAGLLVASSAQASVVFKFAGDLRATSTTFFAPKNSPGVTPPTEVDDVLHPYQALSFEAPTSAPYTIDLTSNLFDSTLTLYQDSFSPASPLLNALDFSDDRAPLDLRPLITYGLTAGTRYYVVVSNYEPADRSLYTIEVSTPDVPEPSTWALMVLGTGAVGASMRRRRSMCLRGA